MTGLISISINDLWQRWLQTQLPAAVANGSVDPTYSGGTGYPIGALARCASSGNVANATATATLSSAANVTNYITGFEVTGAGATAGLPVTVTVTGLIGGVTLSYTYDFASSPTTGNLPLVVDFLPAIPASGANTAIAVSCPASGLGGTNNTVTVHGYRV